MLTHPPGPMPLLGDPGHKDIVYSLKNRIPKILGLGTPSQPRAIVLVTAHWTTDNPRISSAPSHELLYDYYNFPAEAYTLKYPAAGHPDIAREVEAAFQNHNLQPTLDDQRGWDHGVFVPMLLVNPAADVPIIQVSVLLSEDSDAHLRMGDALRGLRASNIAIVGSGFASFHNFRESRRLRDQGPAGEAEFKKRSEEWSAALTEAVATPGRDERWKKVGAWRELPHAYTMHPDGGGEHFMPLVVCAGAAEDGEVASQYVDDYNEVDIYTYYWGAETVA